jgi:pimeloyl-ACP methyl ester carboxylesterase
MPDTITVTLDGTSVPVTLTDRGSGSPVVLLHGGGGPLTVEGFADLFAATGRRVITPVHPGFGGTDRPDVLTTVAGLARLYAGLIETMDLTDVTVVGNSIGGWIAAEIAVAGSSWISHVVLVDAVGLQLDEFPIVDFFSLTMDQVAELSYHDPDSFRIDVSALPPAAQAVMATNRAALAVYGGSGMSDPTLLDRLGAVTVPTLVVWGAADRIVRPEHGHAYADAVPGARFELIDDAGHLPQLETPHKLADLIAGFAG